MRDFHRNLANVTKCHRGWAEEVFNGAPPSAVSLESPEAMIKEIAYTIAQAVVSGAVKYGKDWPGVTIRAADLGRRVFRVKRPDRYFAADNPDYPEYVELRLKLPTSLIEHFGSEDAVRAAVQVEVDRLENDARNKARDAGRTFLGAKRVTRVPFTKRARSREAFGKLNPRFAAGGNVEAARRALGKLRAFHAAYRVPLFTLKGPPGFQGHGTRGVRATEAQHARPDARLSSRRRAVARRRSRVSGVFGSGASCLLGSPAAGCRRRASA